MALIVSDGIGFSSAVTSTDEGRNKQRPLLRVDCPRTWKSNGIGVSLILRAVEAQGAGRRYKYALLVQEPMDSRESRAASRVEWARIQAIAAQFRAEEAAQFLVPLRLLG